MNLKTYPEYKYSADFGDIPSHWKIKRIKNLFQVFNGSTPNPKEENWEGDIVWSTPDDLGKLKGDYIFDSSRKITSKGYQSCGTNLVPKGSIIISSRAPIGHMGIAGVELCTNQGCKSLVPVHKLNNMYFYYLLDSNKSNLQSLGQGATFTELSGSNLKSMTIIEPFFEEQKQISSFLDKKTSEIDLTIEKDTHLIELLKEKRTALINHVVTKGLDPTVKMKESGVEWIGEIPEDWELRKISQSFDIIGSGTTPKSQEERYYDAGDVPWVITGDLNDDILNDTSKKITKEAFRDYSTLKMYQKNSLIIAMYGATIGKISLLNFEACVNQACCVLANSKILKSRFVFYWFLGNKNSIISLSYGGGQPNISQDVIKTLKIQVPPKEKQSEIVRYLEQETSKIDLTIQKIQEHIKLLEEYKKSLIHHVVTGKMDVREVAV